MGIHLGALHTFFKKRIKILCGKPCPVRIPDLAHDRAREDLILIDILRCEDPEVRILVIRLLIREILQGSEHGSVFHIMPVYDRILVREESGIVTVQEDASRKIVLLLKGAVQIKRIVLCLRHRIGLFQSPDSDPADDLGIDLAQLVKIDRIAKQGKTLLLLVR